MIGNCFADVGQRRPTWLTPVVSLCRHVDQTLDGTDPHVWVLPAHLGCHLVQPFEQRTLRLPELLHLLRLLDRGRECAGGIRRRWDSVVLGAARAVPVSVVVGAAADVVAAVAVLLEDGAGVVGDEGEAGEGVVVSGLRRVGLSE
jgi:hypothetical protein